MAQLKFVRNKEIYNGGKWQLEVTQADEFNNADPFRFKVVNFSTIFDDQPQNTKRYPENPVYTHIIPVNIRIKNVENIFGKLKQYPSGRGKSNLISVCQNWFVNTLILDTFCVQSIHIFMLPGYEQVHIERVLIDIYL